MSNDKTNPTYKKSYRLRSLGENGLNIVVSVPRPVIEREAERVGLSVDDFLGAYGVVAEYNGFPGLKYTFKKTTPKKDE